MKSLLPALLLLLAPALAEDAPPAATGPQAKIETSLGAIVVALDAEKAPATVKNFRRYVKDKHFDGTVVYRVVPGFVIQMGSVTATGLGRKMPVHPPVALESANGLKNLRGAVAMARADAPASATSEFFIDLADNTFLDAKPTAAPNKTGYAVFGRVVAGMEVADAIAAVPLKGGKGPFPEYFPKTPVKILKVTVSDTPFVVPAPVPPPPAAPAAADDQPPSNAATP